MVTAHFAKMCPTILLIKGTAVALNGLMENNVEELFCENNIQQFVTSKTRCLFWEKSRFIKFSILLLMSFGKMTKSATFLSTRNRLQLFHCSTMADN